MNPYIDGSIAFNPETKEYVVLKNQNWEACAGESTPSEQKPLLEPCSRTRIFRGLQMIAWVFVPPAALALGAAIGWMILGFLHA
jgi:hypothetical protein